MENKNIEAKLKLLNLEQIPLKLVILGMIIVIYISITTNNLYQDTCSNNKISLYLIIVGCLISIVRVIDINNILLNKTDINRNLWILFFIVMIINLVVISFVSFVDVFINNYERKLEIDYTLMASSILNFLAGLIIINFKIHHKIVELNKIYLGIVILIEILIIFGFLYYTTNKIMTKYNKTDKIEDKKENKIGIDYILTTILDLFSIAL